MIQAPQRLSKACGGKLGYMGSWDGAIASVRAPSEGIGGI